ncbi:MAG: tRNA (adenosine(37)-N6)-dimethylallyltransferase MiaA [Patescibacteria group bacterium]
MNPDLSKVVVILGVTASGKTDLAIKLAKKFNGEVVSADSRQVYKEFAIGTAKPAGHWMFLGGKKEFVSGGIVHHLMDVIDPKEEFTLAEYKKLALGKINEIAEKNKLPFLVGGTALYLKAVLENWNIPQVRPNLSLRTSLSNKPTLDLFRELLKKDPEAAAITGPANKRRIIRALEVIYATGQKFSAQRRAGKKLFEPLKIGIQIGFEDLKKRVAERTVLMIKNGLVEEVHRLKRKYPWSLVPMQSIDYQEFKEYFEGKKSLLETVNLINRHHLAYTKRQMTWFKKDKDIHWVSPDLKLALTESVKLVRDFLTE